MSRGPDRTVTWDQLVRDADPDFAFEARFPVVYRFGGKEWRVDELNSGAYSQEEEQS